MAKVAILATLGRRQVASADLYAPSRLHLLGVRERHLSGGVAAALVASPPLPAGDPGRIRRGHRSGPASAAAAPAPVAANFSSLTQVVLARSLST